MLFLVRFAFYLFSGQTERTLVSCGVVYASISCLMKLKIVFSVKVGVHLKAVFPPLNLGLMRISRSRFKQSKNYLLISQIYVLR